MIHLADEQGRVPIPAAKVRRLAAQILKGASVSIAFVTRGAIRRLNRRYLRHDYATDVLAFPSGPEVGPGSGLLGEVVISPEVASAQARRRKIPVEEELLRYVAHGLLHLLGYDDHGRRDRARMWNRQERELARLGDSRRKRRKR
jgi:probable rRNA maturation factor